MQILTLKDFCPPSLNQIFGKHWRIQKKMKDEIVALICYEAKSQGLKPVKRCIMHYDITHKKNLRRDYDNVCIKQINDGLRYAGILPDDNSEVVTAISMIFHKGTRDITEISIVEL
jgi:Holliday junction resolvase RusA-like endonuclease